MAAAETTDNDDSVALVVELAENSPAHHALVRGILDGVDGRWTWSHPGISPAKARACNGQDSCFLALTNATKATHLVVIGTAPLDATQLVVSIRAYRTFDGAEIFTSGDVITIDDKIREAGKTILGAALAKAPGMPKPQRTKEQSKSATADVAAGPPPLALAGFGVMGLGVLGGVGLAIVAAVGLIDSASAVPTEAVAVAAASVAVIGAAAGVGIVTASAFLDAE